MERMIGLEVSGLIGNPGVCGSMAFIETIAGERLDNCKYLFRDIARVQLEGMVWSAENHGGVERAVQIGRRMRREMDERETIGASLTKGRRHRLRRAGARPAR